MFRRCICYSVHIHGNLFCKQNFHTESSKQLISFISVLSTLTVWATSGRLKLIRLAAAGFCGPFLYFARKSFFIQTKICTMSSLLKETFKKTESHLLRKSILDLFASNCSTFCGIYNMRIYPSRVLESKKNVLTSEVCKELIPHYCDSPTNTNSASKNKERTHVTVTARSL